MIREGVYYYVSHSTKDLAFICLLKRLSLSIKPLKAAVILECLCQDVLRIDSKRVAEFGADIPLRLSISG